MPAVRGARRAGRNQQAEHPRSRRGKAVPPPSMNSMPRLAQIKLSGGLASDDVKVSGKSLVLALTGAVFFLGAGVAGAAWLGSSLFDVREAFARAADGAAANVGFAVDEIQVSTIEGASAISPARAAEVRALIVPEGRQSILSLDPNDVKTRVESLDWVQGVRVRRLWPNDMLIEVERRQEYARWQEDGEISVIDANGERLLTERAADHANLPLVVGQGAGPASPPMLAALESLPQVRAHLRALVRVGDRRWNVELTSGTTVALPEERPEEALAQLEELQTEHALLDRPLAQIDMRVPNRVAIRVHPVLAGGLRPLLGGA
ncbi:cell division protein FtsQ/DivIB [Vitreimonas flagellata]|uniref:cell division protein FtsQ/DivIB n=1 Tax=Vitreimonas flagellata TaxID=2560861 RepID=UPI001074FC4B|nr:cell division protein FtsQ/DivIB [Vitreimonas flagellata]